MIIGSTNKLKYDKSCICEQMYSGNIYKLWIIAYKDACPL